MSDEGERLRSSGWSVALQMLGWLVAFGGGTYAVVDRREPTLVGIIVVAGFVAVLLAQLDKFETLKGGGVELKRRQVEQARLEVEQALAEAKKAQADTREVAQNLIATMLPDLANAGLWGGGPTFASKIETRNRLASLLQHVGASAADVRSAAKPFDDKVRLILATRCVSALANAAPAEEQESIRAMADFKAGKAPTASELTALKIAHELQSDEIAKQLVALAQFEQTGTVPLDYDS